jgi:hypothetical protein
VNKILLYQKKKREIYKKLKWGRIIERPKIITTSGGNMIMRVHQQNPRTWCRPARYFPKGRKALSVRLAWTTWKRRLERAEGRRRHHASYSLLVVGKDRPLLSTPSILPSHHACTYICSVFSPREPTRVCVYSSSPIPSRM